jgi:hypothetical protein
MSKIHIISAMGNAAEQPITAAALTDLDSIDSNRVHVVGPIAPDPVVTINSFGPGTLVEKRVRFDARVIIHHNPPNLILLSGKDRTPNAGDVGKYYADSNGVWREESWDAAPWTQIFTVTPPGGKVYVPVGFTQAFIRMQAPGGHNGTGVGGAPYHFGANGGYLEKTVQAVAGQYASLSLVLTPSNSTTQSQFLTSAGGSPPPPYPDTWSIPTLTVTGGSQLGIGAPQGGTASGGDVNTPGLVGSFVGGVAAMPAGPMCAAQSINSGHAVGLDYGGGCVSVDGVNTLGGNGFCSITWGR